MPAIAPSRSANRLLAALPLGNYRRMSRAFEKISLEFGRFFASPAVLSSTSTSRSIA